MMCSYADDQIYAVFFQCLTFNVSEERATESAILSKRSLSSKVTFS